MRKKIGKRIGPVPIALVAVFALAAFISAGLLLTPTAKPSSGSDRCPALSDTPRSKSARTLRSK